MEMGSFLISKEQPGREEKIEVATPDVVSIKQPKTSLKSGLLFSKVASQFLVLFVLAVGFLQVSFISHSQKHDSQNATNRNSFQPVTLNFKYGTPHTDRSGLYTSNKDHFVPSKQEEYISSRSSRHFFPK